MNYGLLMDINRITFEKSYFSTTCCCRA